MEMMLVMLKGHQAQGTLCLDDVIMYVGVLWGALRGLSCVVEIAAATTRFSPNCSSHLP